MSQQIYVCRESKAFSCILFASQSFLLTKLSNNYWILYWIFIVLLVTPSLCIFFLQMKRVYLRHVLWLEHCNETFQQFLFVLFLLKEQNVSQKKVLKTEFCLARWEQKLKQFWFGQYCKIRKVLMLWWAVCIMRWFYSKKRGNLVAFLKLEFSILEEVEVLASLKMTTSWKPRWKITPLFRHVLNLMYGITASSKNFNFKLDGKIPLTYFEVSRRSLNTQYSKDLSWWKYRTYNTPRNLWFYSLSMAFLSIARFLAKVKQHIC